MAVIVKSSNWKARAHTKNDEWVVEVGEKPVIGQTQHRACVRNKITNLETMGGMDGIMELIWNKNKGKLL